jgi:CRISPR-associated protein (TIGR03985 family)
MSLVSELIFQDVPQVELLQWLAQGLLKQKLLRTIRLWVWLRSLYGDIQDRLVLDDAFTYADWRSAFFRSCHTKGEEVPSLHNSECPCAKTTKEWLFNETTGIVAQQWQESLLAHTDIGKSKLHEILNQRLFGVTRRSLQGDLETLAELGWLVYKNERYYRVTEFPPCPVRLRDEIDPNKLNTDELNFLHEDLVEIAENHSHEINGIQRFFLKVDYVIPRITLDSVGEWQYQLRQIWNQTPVPPVKLTYASAKFTNQVDCIVYPVCIYYMQRAVYLCAYGDSPDHQSEWYNFRLDRIQKMIPLSWDNSHLPLNLQQKYHGRNLPSPEHITLEMSKAWGFDFYLPVQLMLLRFDQDFSDRYIKGTKRHETFTAISYQQAQRLIQREVKQPQQQQALLEIISCRSPVDAYYQALIRYQDQNHRDNNVIMRLRAWQPKCEVLLPFDLRQSIATDLAQAYQLYH